MSTAELAVELHKVEPASCGIWSGTSVGSDPARPIGVVFLSQDAGKPGSYATQAFELTHSLVESFQKVRKSAAVGTGKWLDTNTDTNNETALSFPCGDLNDKNQPGSCNFKHLARGKHLIIRQEPNKKVTIFNGLGGEMPRDHPSGGA